MKFLKELFMTPLNNLSFRREMIKTDPITVRDILISSGYFSNEEVEVGMELAKEALLKGELSGYYFIMAEIEKEVAGYCCFGPVPLTRGSFDLYWIAVHEKFRGKGLGKQILSECLKDISSMNGKRVYAETSSREQYTPTRMFYERNGFIAEARLANYYDDGEDLVVYNYEV